MVIYFSVFRRVEGLKKKQGKWPSAKGDRAWLEHWTGILIIITVGSSGHHSLFSVGGKYYIDGCRGGRLEHGEK